MTSGREPGEHCAVMIFTRSPLSARSKTRLALEIGRSSATQIAVAMLHASIENAQQAGLDAYCSYVGDDYPDYLPASAKTIFHQGRPEESSLAALDRARLDARAHHLGRVIFIPSDAPTVDPDLLKEMAMSLHEYDVAISPSRDGGIAAIGLRGRVSIFFNGIAGSTGEVAAEVLARIQTTQYRVWVAAERLDLDTADAIRTALAEGMLQSSPELVRVIQDSNLRVD